LLDVAELWELYVLAVLRRAASGLVVRHGTREIAAAGNARRAINIHEGEEVDESAFKALIRQAVALNSSRKSKPSKRAKS